MKDPVSRFSEFALSHSEHPAVIQDGIAVSYGELHSLSGRIANSLAGVCNNPRVLIYLPKSADAYAAMFGTLMASGYYSPINMDAPVQRHIEIFEQFCPDVVVSLKGMITALPLSDSKCCFVDIEDLSYEELIEPLDGHELAYVFFTSGSTGQPKGVMIPRTGLAHYTNWAIDAMNVSPHDRWSQHPNIAFDLSVLDIYGAICGGATLYPLISKKDKLLPADFIKRNELTIWNSVPSVIDLMTRARQVTNENFKSLRLLTFCGEPLYPRHLDTIFAANENVVVHNTYGPTEATVSCTLVRMTADDYPSVCGSSVALGQPIPGMEIVLLGGKEDEGEVALIGEQLAVGYWQNEIATDNAFVSLKTEQGVKRAYRTGDWATIKDGEYYFAGRIDHQVKIRGNRVELDEIDTTIHKLGYGNSCTVFVNNELHSFLETNQLPSLLGFKVALAEFLPEYEIPQHIQAIEEFPINNNDKVDRKKLAELIVEN